MDTQGAEQAPGLESAVHVIAGVTMAPGERLQGRKDSGFFFQCDASHSL